MITASTLTEADRLAAVGVTASQSGHKFELQLGHLCNNRCVFCSSGQLTALKVARTVPIEPILEALEQARASGATHLTFLGGEPTTHKRFLEALTRARDLGFEHIVIFTNGVMFPQPGFIDSVTALGSFEWRISIQGATEEAHVATTGREDSFRRIVHGLGELRQRGQLVTTNMCVNERSYRSLPHYPELLERHGVRQLHVDIVRPDSTGQRDESYLREIMPRYSLMAPYYAQMLEGFEQRDPDFDVNVGNLPYCILPAWGSSIHHGGEPTVTMSSDGVGLDGAVSKYDWHESLRTHLPGCADCVFRPDCTGIFRAYLAIHGGEEFQPVTREALLALDPQRRNLVRLVAPLLGELRAAISGGTTPAAWSRVSDTEDERRRRIEIRFAHEGGAEVTLRWLRPGRAGHPILRTADYDLEADAVLSAAPAALDELFSWVRTQLLTMTPDLPDLAPDAADLSLHGALLERGRHRVGQLSARLSRRFRLAGWRLGDLQWPVSDRAQLGAYGPAGSQVDLVFTIGANGGRSQVDARFEPTDTCSPESAGIVIEHLGSLLQA